MLRVCVQSYPPFVVYTGSKGPVSYASLVNDSALAGVLLTDSATLPYVGFDIEMARAIFQTALGVPQLQFLPSLNSHDAYVSLRNGACDVLMSAAELEWRRTLCTSACQPPPLPAWSAADYESEQVTQNSTGWLTTECCLLLSAPYYYSDLGVAVLSTKKTLVVWSSVSSPLVVNWLLIVGLMAFVAGWLITLAEYGNNDRLQSLSDGVYFALTTISTVGYGDVTPQTALGQITGMSLMGVSLIVIVSFSSLLSSQLTAAALSGSTVTGLADLPSSAHLCIENGYELAARVAAAANRPYSYDTIQNCMSALSAGRVGGVLHDVPILNWYQSQFGTSSKVYVSGSVRVNPFVAVFPAGSPLLAWANPAIASATSDPVLSAVQAALERKYLASVGGGGSASDGSVYSPSLGFTLLAFVVITYSPRLRFLVADVKKNLPHTLHAALRWAATMGQRIRGVDVDGEEEAHVAAPVEHAGRGPGSTRAEMVFDAYDEEDWDEPPQPPPPPPPQPESTSWLWGSKKPPPPPPPPPPLPSLPLREKAPQRRARDDPVAAEVEMRAPKGGGRNPRSADGADPNATVIWSTFKPKGGMR